MTPAQWYSLVVGAALTLVGILGFFVDAGFDVGTDIDGDTLLGFEVNGWHNIVHLASGLLGLAAFRARATALTFALAFGVVYLIVAAYGFIAGDQVLALVPVNGADNVLHLALGVLGVGSWYASRRDADRV
jgi:hypothetical protein